MRVKPKQIVQVLSISERQPEVVRIFDDLVTFKVFFNLDAQSALESGLVICDFKILADKKIETQKLKVSSLESRFALSTASKRKSVSISKSNNTVMVGKIDITQHISNDKIMSISRGTPAKSHKIIKLVNNEESNASSIRPITSSLFDGVEKNDNLVLSYNADLLHRQGKDPAEKINSSPFHAPISSAIRGFSTTAGAPSLNGKAVQFRKSFVQNGKTSIKTMLENDDLKTLEIPFKLNLKKGKIGFYSVEINAMKESKKILQTIKFDIDLQRAFENFIIPTIAPNLLVTCIGSSNFVKIQQMDNNSSSVEVFRRNVSEKSGESNSPFVRITNIKLKKGDQTQFIDRGLQAGKCIYRAIPTNELSITSGEFSSVVINSRITKKRKVEPDTLTLLAFESESAVVITAYNIPNDIIALRLVRKNLTIKESSFSSPSTVVDGPLKSFSRTATDVLYKDLPTRQNAVYEYKFVMIDSYGDERESQRSSMIQFSGDIEAQEGRTLNVQPAKASTDQMSKVVFQISAPTDQASLDKIYSILADAGFDTYYVDEIKKNRELLNKISAFEVMRFDTTTGQNESFGAVKSGVFEDGPLTRKAASVSQLVPGRKYIYQFRLLLRSTSTVFNGIHISQTDLETGRNYSTDLKKFNSPLVLKRGTLSSTVKQQQTISKTGLKQDSSSNSDSELFEGRTALTGQAAVQLPSANTIISNLLVEETPRGNVIRWNVSQGSQNIDHVIIFAEYNGQRAPLRAVHYSGRSKMIFLDNKLEASSNEILYFVCPVFTDFKQGGLVGPAEVKDGI